MPRQKIDEYWADKVHDLAESEPRPSAALIELRLRKIGEQEGRKDWPAKRTIGRILSGHRKLSERQKAFYREFRWPQAMLAELVPWEATRVSLGVLSYYIDKYKVRPTVRRILWHWRLSLVNPDWEIANRDVYVSLMLATLASGRTIIVSDSEDEMLYAAVVSLSPQDLDLSLISEPWKYDPREFPHHKWEIEDEKEG